MAALSDAISLSVVLNRPERSFASTAFGSRDWGLRKCLPLVLEGALSAPQALVEHSLVRALVRLVRQRRRRET